MVKLVFFRVDSISASPTGRHVSSDLNSQIVRGLLRSSYLCRFDRVSGLSTT